MNRHYERLKKKADIVFDLAMEKTDGMLELDGLLPVERAVVLTYHFLGFAGGMGLEGMLDDEMDADPGYVKTIEAFREIGAFQIAEIIEEGIARKTSMAIGLDTSQFRDFNSLEEEFFAREHECVEQMGRYVEFNETK